LSNNRTFPRCWWKWEMCNQWKTVWEFLKRLSTHLSHDPVFPLLDVYLKELKAWATQISVPWWMAVLAVILTRCQATGKWINRLWDGRTISNLKDTPLLQVTTRMNLKLSLPCEWCQIKRNVRVWCHKMQIRSHSRWEEGAEEGGRRDYRRAQWNFLERCMCSLSWSWEWSHGYTSVTVFKF
jgi:hypothetical protein